MKNEQEILTALKHDWDIDSVEGHTNGYWDFLDNSFDLRLLKTKQELKEDELRETYLTIENDRVLISINGDKSFYEIEDLSESQLCLTCYFQDNENKHELIKLVTFRLSRKMDVTQQG